MLIKLWGLLARGVSTGAAWLARGGRWKWAVGTMTVLAAAVTIYVLVSSRSSLRQQNDELTEALAASRGEVELLRQARAADSAALSARDTGRLSVIQKDQNASKRIDAALAAHPQWASQPVPGAVLDSLRDQ